MLRDLMLLCSAWVVHGKPSAVMCMHAYLRAIRGRQTGVPSCALELHIQADVALQRSAALSVP